MTGLRLTPLTILLLVSLLLNGVFLGVGLADKFSEPRHHRSRDMDKTGFVISAFLHAAPDDQRDALKDDLKSQFGEAKALHRRAWEAQSKVYDALTAEDFDRADAESALADMRAARLAVDEKGHEMMLNLVEKLDADTRMRALEAGFGGDMRHHRGPRRGREGREDGDRNPPLDGRF